MTTLFVVGVAGLVAAVMAALALSWFVVRAVFWVLFLPFMLLKAAFGFVFGLVFGALGLLIGLGVTVVVGLVGLAAALAVLAIPLVPLLGVALLVWLGVKATSALASA